MRVMFACSMGGSGHLTPVMKVAEEFRRRGHEGVFLVPPSLADTAAAAGIRVEVGGQPAAEVAAEIWQRVRAGPADQVAGLIDRELFAGIAADRMRDAAQTICAEFVPDLVVREPCEYASAMAAWEAKVPQAQIGISLAAIEDSVLTSVGQGLEGRCPGLVQTIRTSPYLTSFAEAIDPSPWRDTRRYRLPSEAPHALPDWWATMVQRPLVYVTFGSVLGGTAEAAETFRTALDAVAGLPVRVLMTVGRGFDASLLGPVPENTHIEAWVPQADVLAAADLVVCHGGSGTTNGALSAGLPLVICPLFADNFANAATVERLGAGVIVRSDRPAAGGVASLERDDSARLASAITLCLNEPGFTRQALAMADVIAAAPSLPSAVQRLAG